jgi:tetratricopeptide (TPR) repeat protein
MRCAVAVLAVLLAQASAPGQKPVDEDAPALSPVASLGLTPEKVSHLNQAIAEHEYVAAEKLLLDELASETHSARSARLLAYAGSIYFLNRDYLEAAIAWKKSDAITPLDESLQFSLAMAYVGMGHVDWAMAQLEKLAKLSPQEAIYPYWLGRLEYDAQHYDAAIEHFKLAARLAPEMMRSYDKLGLCYFYLNQNALAMENFQKAIELNRKSQHPSAWPYLDAAVTLQFMGRLPEGEADLREALKVDPQFAAAHYRLGNVLEDEGLVEAAVPELLEAARLDESYAEPHMALARLYKRLGRKEDAEREVQVYLRLHAVGTAQPAPRQP